MKRCQRCGRPADRLDVVSLHRQGSELTSRHLCDSCVAAVTQAMTKALAPRGMAAA